MEIWQVKKLTRYPHGGKICGIEAEEIYAGLVPAQSHIGSYVHLGKTRQTRQRRHPVRANAAHTKRDNSHPALATELIEFKLRGDDGPQHVVRQWPVGEE